MSEHAAFIQRQLLTPPTPHDLGGVWFGSSKTSASSSVNQADGKNRQKRFMFIGFHCFFFYSVALDQFPGYVETTADYCAIVETLRVSAEYGSRCMHRIN